LRLADSAVAEQIRPWIRSETIVDANGNKTRLITRMRVKRFHASHHFTQIFQIRKWHNCIYTLFNVSIISGNFCYNRQIIYWYIQYVQKVPRIEFLKHLQVMLSLDQIWKFLIWSLLYRVYYLLSLRVYFMRGNQLNDRCFRVLICVKNRTKSYQILF